MRGLDPARAKHLSAALAANLTVTGVGSPRVESTSLCLKAFRAYKNTTGSSSSSSSSSARRRLSASAITNTYSDGVTVYSVVMYSASFSAAVIAAAQTQAASAASSSSFNPAAGAASLSSYVTSLVVVASPPPSSPTVDVNLLWIVPLIVCTFVGLAVCACVAAFLARRYRAERQRGPEEKAALQGEEKAARDSSSSIRDSATSSDSLFTAPQKTQAAHNGAPRPSSSVHVYRVSYV